MAIALPGTESASDANRSVNTPAKHDRTMNLGQHSLNTVVGHNKLLWRLPRRWTQAHLDVLCVDRQSDSGTGNLDRNEDEPSLHALIPRLTSLLEHYIESMAKGGPPQQRAVFLDKILRVDGEDVSVNPHNTKAIPFSGGNQRLMELAVGRRGYRLPLLTVFHLGSLLLSYLDSAQIHWPPSRVTIGDLSNQPYEPCIVAVLIAMAQANASSGDKSVVKTRLIFTHRDDDQHIHVYTARVSQRLLERLRHPNQPPTNDASAHTTPSLVKLQHTCVPYQPYDTFQHRILAAVSVTATIVHSKDAPPCRKRKASNTDDAIDPKRQRQRGSRTPLINLSPNRYAT
ncbi:hypothetical protein O1611_g3737 [Lasiodiplodia mahajangana]|uniref:Uncharacterized protein n=1 Tax=Lasiodiplodia mahajangana TaxID=1108764 RepID=A0ACC2JRB3_9PEZI|nr:hypothetical protein O1611_g3737 [Lasiodiplodia mahajangana]